MEDNIIKYHIISFDQKEHEELLELFKNNPKWKSRIENGFEFVENHFYGCADSGFCFGCKIIVGDPTCFCSGGKCPKCGGFVSPRNIPKDLNGIYEKHTSLGVIKQRYKNGEWQETIKT